MTKIKFGTDGWRAIIAKDYTVDNVKRIAAATAEFMKEKGLEKAVVGYDTRFGGQMFAETTSNILADAGIKVLLGKSFVSTPMVSLGIVKTESDLGIVITASHNPPSYNGFKLKSSFGGPTIPKEIAEVESKIVDTIPVIVKDYNDHIASGAITLIDLEDIYIEHIEANFDLDKIRSSSINLAYDAMYGAGQNAIKHLFPDALLMHCDNNPGFKGLAPEPIARNLRDLSSTIKNSPSINLGLANDGDADRVGLFDENGQFVDAHHILLLLLFYMYEHKKLKGKVVYSFSVTNKLKKLADHFGLKSEVTKIGFKYIAEIMINEDVLVGGEESGGLAVKGHIPERDGIWIGLVIMEFMAKTGKTLLELIHDIYEIVGAFTYDRDDLHLTNEEKNIIINRCKNGEITHIGEKEIIETETLDGFKFILSEDEWVMVRPSGTEPVLRVYAQAGNADALKKILEDAHVTLKG